MLPVRRVVLAVGEHRGLGHAAPAGALRARRRAACRPAGRSRRRAGAASPRAARRCAPAARGGSREGRRTRSACGRCPPAPATRRCGRGRGPGRRRRSRRRRAAEAVQGGLVVVGGGDDLGGDDALGDDPPLAVDVGDEGVERADALGEAALDRLPVRGGDHARDGIDVELEVALQRRETHAGALERTARRGRAARRRRRGRRPPGRRGPRAGRAVGSERLVEDALAHRIVGEQVVHSQGGHRAED